MATVAPHVVDPDNIPGLIHPIMQRHHLQPKDIKKEKRGQVVPGRGEFFCNVCNCMWSSRFAWAQIDLVDQRITYRWVMKCKMCMSHCKPTFSIPEIEKMIEKAIYLYKGEKYPHAGKGKVRKFYLYDEEHLPTLCEKCGWGQKECWVEWRKRN